MCMSTLLQRTAGVCPDRLWMCCGQSWRTSAHEWKTLSNPAQEAKSTIGSHSPYMGSDSRSMQGCKTDSHRSLFFLIASTGLLKRLRAPEKALITDERSSEAWCAPPSMSVGVCIPDGLGATAQGDCMGRDRNPCREVSSLHSTKHWQ